MLSAFRHRSYRRLLGAHLLSIIGTGLTTIAIGFVAFNAAGDQAATVLGLLFAIKIAVYLVLAPLAPLIAARMGARRLLATTDLVRALIAIALPFVDNIAMACVLIVALQSASALFTPTYQAVIPRILNDDREYIGALALFRLTYDLETMFSPALAGALLLVLPSTSLFWGTSIGFMASAALILSVFIPSATQHDEPLPVRTQLTRGLSLMLTLRPLKGVVALNLALAASGSIVLTLTIPLARGVLGATEAQSSLLLTAFGVGSIAAAIVMTVLVKQIGPHRFMLGGIWLLSAAMLAAWPAFTLLPQDITFGVVCAIWLLAGIGYSATLAPIGRILRDTALPADLPYVFAAQFTLSHAWWMLAYLIAGPVASFVGFGTVIVCLALTSLTATFGVIYFWRPALRRGSAANSEQSGTFVTK